MHYLVYQVLTLESLLVFHNNYFKFTFQILFAKEFLRYYCIASFRLRILLCKIRQKFDPIRDKYSIRDKNL